MRLGPIREKMPRLAPIRRTKIPLNLSGQDGPRLGNSVFDRGDHIGIEELDEPRRHPDPWHCG